jgi:hypothetical protein
MFSHKPIAAARIQLFREQLSTDTVNSGLAVHASLKFYTRAANHLHNRSEAYFVLVRALSTAMEGYALTDVKQHFVHEQPAAVRAYLNG